MQRTAQKMEAMGKIAWVQCDRREAWFQWACVNLGKEDVENTTFFCV